MTIGNFGNIRADQQIYQEAGVSGLVPNSAAAGTANTTALQAAIDTAIVTQAGSSFAKRGKKLTIPTGNYYINNTLTIADAYGFQLIGDGTALIWNGNDNTKPAILMSHCQSSSVEDLLINIATPAYAAIQCRRDNHEGATIAPTSNRFENIFIDGSGCVYGVVLGGAGSVDANNDFNRFVNVRATGYTTAGFLLDGSQSFNNLFTNCWAVAYAGASYGVTTGAVGGSFIWDGGFVGAHTVADFSIGRSNFPSVAKNFNSEGSQTILEIISEMYTHITLDNFRWAGNVNTGGAVIVTPADAKTIQLRITNSRIGDSGDVGAGCPAFTIPINLVVTGSFIFENNTFYTGAADPFPTSSPTNTAATAGNVKVTDEIQMTREALTW